MLKNMCAYKSSTFYLHFRHRIVLVACGPDIHRHTPHQFGSETPGSRTHSHHLVCLVSFYQPVTLRVTQNPYSSASSLNSSELFGMKIFFIFIKRQSNIRSIKQEGIVSSISSSASLWTPEKVSFSSSIVYPL